MVRSKSKDRNLKNNYGISVEDYDKLFRKQRGRCQLCYRQPGTFAYDLAVDHCHDTGRIRGLLCNECNQLLKHYRTIDYFKRVVEYLSIDNTGEKPYT